MRESTPNYLDLKHLSRESCICVRSLRAFLKDASHPLPFFKVRGKVLVSWSEFKAWIEAYRIDHTGQGKVVDNIVSEILHRK